MRKKLKEIKDTNKLEIRKLQEPHISALLDAVEKGEDSGFYVRNIKL